MPTSKRLVSDMTEQGSILSETAYAQGKMLDHSEWQPLLPRGITPSDIDAVVATGQRRLFEDIIRGSQGQHWAASVKHDVPSVRAIRTVSDIESFQVMFMDLDNRIARTRVVPAGENGVIWSRFIKEFYNDRTEALRWCFVQQLPVGDSK